MKHCVVAILMLLLAMPTGLQAQLLNFDILLFGEKVGNVVVTRKVNADSTEVYSLESRSKAHFLWIDKENYSRYDVVYKNGVMLSSESKEIENGKTKRWTKAKWDGTQYLIDSYKGKRVITGPIPFSVVKMFFLDGTKQSQIFYESEAESTKIKNPKPGICEFNGSDGSRNVYIYQNGKLVGLEFHVSIATVKLVRTN